MNVMLNEKPEMTLADIDAEILLETGEIQAYQMQQMYPNENKKIIEESISRHREKLNKLYRLKKLRS